jgi:hypothetical protein
VTDCYQRAEACFEAGVPGCEGLLPTCDELASECGGSPVTRPADCYRTVDHCLALYDDCLALGGGDCIRIIEICGAIASTCP